MRRLTELDPPIDDPESALSEHRVLVDGAIVTNPASQVLPGARIVVKPPTTLQGVRKLGAALDHFDVSVERAVAVDLGACTGGFTRALLDHGAAKVYAVDVGYGQLLGSLAQDARVVSLERTNVAQVTPELLGTRPDIVTCDVTKLALREVGRQLATNDVPRPGTDFLGLVKPMFELATGQLPAAEELAVALQTAIDGLNDVGWETIDSIESPVVGHRGAVEYFVHARWS